MAKKEKTTMTAIWDQMEKLYGDDGLGNISAVEVLSTGSYALDDAIGPWGIPRGRIIQYAGKESSGKTFMSLMAIKNWQQQAPHNWAYFIDAECGFDPTWAKTLGVDLKRLKILRSNNGAEIFEKLCGVPHKEPGKPKSKLGLLDLVKENGGSDKSGLGLIVLDSVAAISPPLEMASHSGKSNMALLARFLPPELRKIVTLLSETGVSLIAINQVRTDPGKMYGDPTSTPGGAAWKHYCSVMVHFLMSESKDSKIFNERGEQVGHMLRARIDKNRVGPPKRECQLAVKYVEGVGDKHVELATLATKYGVVKRPNNRTYIYNDINIVGKDNYYNTVKDWEQLKLFGEIQEAKLNNFSEELEVQEDEEENNAAKLMEEIC
jgi:recombination protein RecA